MRAITSLTIVLGCLLLSWSCSPSVLANNFVHYTVSDGLPKDFVFKAIQDRKGYIWFATEHGLSRFDGVQFENFAYESGLTEEIIVRIYEDRKGRIWIASFSGKVFYYENGVFHKPQNTPWLRGAFSEINYITYFYEDNEGSLWLIGDYANVYQINDTAIIHHKKIFDLPAYRFRFNAIFQTKTGRLITMVNSRFLCDWETEEVLDSIPELSNPLSITMASNTELLYVSKAQTNHPDPGPSVVSIDIENGKKKYSIPLDAEEGNVNRLDYCIRDSRGDFWVGSRGDGLFYVPAQGGAKHIRNYLRGIKVSSILEDNEHNLWITTDGKGVYFLGANAKNAKIYNSANGLTDDIVFAIEKDSANTLWAGLSNGFIAYIKDDQITPILLNEFDSSHVSCKGLIALPNNTIHAGSDLGLYEIVNGKKIKFSPTGVTKSIWISRQGKELVASRKGVFEVNEEALWYPIPEDYRKYIPDLNRGIKLYKGRTTCSVLDQNNKLWVGTTKGLLTQEIINGDTLLINFGKSYPYLNSNISDLHIDELGRIWVASSSYGVILFDSDSIIRIRQKDGLTSNLTNCIFQERPGTIWVGTSNGLNRLQQDSSNGQWQIKHYSTADGLPSPEILSVYVDEDTIYVGTTNGLGVFLESSIQTNTQAPKVYIRKFRVAGRDTSVVQGHRFPPRMNSIEVEFVGLNYRSLGNIGFKYRLFPLHEHWSYTKTNRVEYASLPPGEYTFTVSAQNSSGIWANEPASIQFEIKPPYYQTWWFRLLMAMIFLQLIWAIFTIRIGQLKRKQRNRESMLEMEQKVLRAQMNPHFLFNCLQSIQNFINKGDDVSANVYLSKFAALMRLILDLSQKTMVSLSDEMKALELFLELESLRFEQKFSYHFEIAADIDPNQVQLPPMLLQPFVENAIKHGLLNKKDPGKLWVRVKREGDSIMCIIEDDGVGREQASLFKSKRQKQHQSVGITLTKERLNHLNWRTGSNLKIIDLYDEDGIPNGTRVEILIPF